jgi:hypothetical protein
VGVGADEPADNLLEILRHEEPARKPIAPVYVRRRPDHGAVARESVRERVGDATGVAGFRGGILCVGDEPPALQHHHVVSLEIAMDDALLVCRVDDLAQAVEQRDRARQWQPTSGLRREHVTPTRRAIDGRPIEFRDSGPHPKDRAAARRLPT